ncbi:hypothetical protein HDC30_002383 [Pseudomonas sp. JAI115]|nr:hypothetical protein [Pseudomonas sp. JAI115]
MVFWQRASVMSSTIYLAAMSDTTIFENLIEKSE